MSTKWHIHRRAFLRGLGAAIALPVLDAMLPSLGSVVSAANATAAQFPKRMAFLYVPNGVALPDWTPKSIGSDFSLPRILKPLAAHKNDFSILTGLDQKNGMAIGDGAGDHARASATFLTGAHPRKTSGSNIRAGISVDQLAAQKIGDQTTLPSLELSCDAGPRLGACDSGYSCAYQFNLSWRSETMPANPEVDPRRVFERLFGSGSQASARRAQMDRSILDFVADDARRLKGRLGNSDQGKMDEYLTAIRQIEKRLTLAEKSAPKLPTGVHAPAAYESFEEQVKLMMDMLALSFQTDSTRIATFLLAHEGSNRPYPFIGVNDGHHDLSHHFGDPKNIEKITQINTFHIRQFAYLLEKLKSIREENGTLLDNCMVVYGSGISDGNAHSHTNLPVLLAGRGGGTITPGRHIKVDNHAPLNNLFLSLLDRLGSPTQRFGDSTGRLEQIA